jgi:hypothetical protein
MKSKTPLENARLDVAPPPQKVFQLPVEIMSSDHARVALGLLNSADIKVGAVEDAMRVRLALQEIATGAHIVIVKPVPVVDTPPAIVEDDAGEAGTLVA